jgi:hypothetical protein
MTTEELLREVAEAPESRLELWGRFLNAAEVREMAEVGVFRGDFVARPDEEFDKIYAEAMERTDPWREKRVVLRGTTTEVIGRLPDRALDFVYIDGDHTLREKRANSHFELRDLAGRFADTSLNRQLQLRPSRPRRSDPRSLARAAGRRLRRAL